MDEYNYEGMLRDLHTVCTRVTLRPSFLTIEINGNVATYMSESTQANILAAHLTVFDS